ncbi:MAG: redox-regulated ATPase YchF [archaeon]
MHKNYLIEMQLGVVGKPNTGKSTFFSAATLIDVEMQNYPFTTIEANKGMGFVRVECVEKEFEVKCNPRTGYCVNGTRFVPVELIDVAGLVPGASEGKGLGNKFLDDLRKADVLIHVIDLSGGTNEKGEIVPKGSYDSINDVLFLEKEIELWFLGIIKKNWNKFAKIPVKEKNRKLEAMAQNLSGIGASALQIDKAVSKLDLWEKSFSEWTETDLEAFAKAIRQESKPIVIAANKADIASKEQIEKLKKRFPEKIIIPCSAVSELTLKKAAKEKSIEYLPGKKSFSKIKELNEKQEQGLNYIEKNVLQKFGSTGVQEILDTAVFELLKYIAIFPGGVKGLTDSEGRTLPDCWLLPEHSTALDFAFKLHTDIGENFIRAIDVKTRQMIGKDHELKNRDVIEIIFNKK